MKCLLPLQVQVSRYDVFMTPEAEAALPQATPEASLWRLRGRGSHKEHPLLLYGIRAVSPIKDGKGMVLPEQVAAYEARASPHLLCFALAGHVEG